MVDLKDASKPRHIGPKSAAWLRQVGIRTIEDIREHGALTSYLKLKRAGFKPGLNVLYALVGAEHERPMNSLTPEEKAVLVDEVAAYDEAQKEAKKQVFEVRDVTAQRKEAGPRYQRLGTARGPVADAAVAVAPASEKPTRKPGAGTGAAVKKPSATRNRASAMPTRGKDSPPG